MKMLSILRLTLDDLLLAKDQTIKRNALSIVKQLQRNLAKQDAQIEAKGKSKGKRALKP